MALKKFRQQLIEDLWQTHRSNNTQMKLIEDALKRKGINQMILDHFAIIDLPGPNSGIPQLKKIFSMMGFLERGCDYLKDKQNDFSWLAEIDCDTQNAKDVLPQIVVADFRLEELPEEVKKIIEKYAYFSKSPPLEPLALFLAQIDSNTDMRPILKHLKKYFSGRDWPLPTLHEYHTVHEFNELLSWVLVFGRLPNHFTLSIHLLNHFHNLKEFLNFITDEIKLPLNMEGGKIKGERLKGIEQSSTVGHLKKIALADGFINAPTSFVEFVWRHSLKQDPRLWEDYFTDFLAQQADFVIASLL